MVPSRIRRAADSCVSQSAAACNNQPRVIFVPTSKIRVEPCVILDIENVGGSAKTCNAGRVSCQLVMTAQDPDALARAFVEPCRAARVAASPDHRRIHGCIPEGKPSGTSGTSGVNKSKMQLMM